MGNYDLFNIFVRRYKYQKWKEEEALRLQKRNEEFNKYKNQKEQTKNLEL